MMVGNKNYYPPLQQQKANMNKLILCDCDGVLVDYHYALRIWTGRDDIPDTYYPREVIEEFNDSYAMGFLPPLKDARHYIELLQNHGYKIHMITSMGLNTKSHILRKKNLEHLYGRYVFSDMTFLDLKARKIDILKQYENTNLFWIEDNTINAQDGLDLGLKSILVNNITNKNEIIDCIRVNSWKEIYSHITSDISDF